MPILDLRILPPFAIGRFGSSPNPLEAFELELREDDPLGFREIVPRDTLKIDPETGAVTDIYTPPNIKFRDGEQIRPVAPFLEVYAQTSPDTLEPLTLKLLEDERLTPDAIHWQVTVGNLKVYRQTKVDDDKVVAQVDWFNDHKVHELRGECNNFLKDKYIPFGGVRYIDPTKDYPEIRLRFTPAAGLVYGADSNRLTDAGTIADPVFQGHEDRIVYDATRGTWRGFQSDVTSLTLTNPSDIYQGTPSADPKNPLATSWGYLDDVCDGPVAVRLTLSDGKTLTARAWISAAMPAFAPDSQPVRTVADDLEQLIWGPEIQDNEISLDAALEIVRRGLESVRLLNTLAMNGNIIDGRVNIAHTLVTQDSNDFGRAFAPIMAASLVDNLAIRALHERIYAALKSGSAPWFDQVLRRPEEVGDLSDKGRRKMPAMLRGAESRCLALTRRQIDKVTKAATRSLFPGDGKNKAGDQ
ncbi:MAG: hypothetical protein JOY83_17660 [Alphaproteobacteria bacterium]|nr:hypothetical protein [Alphaproteobacteria bacterium]